MKTNIKNVLEIGFCMFGTLVGAGFASGKEVWVYFAKWGSDSFFNIFLTALMFFFASFLFFSFGQKFNITTVQKTNLVLYKKFSFISELVLCVSNVLILSSMFAGADSLLFSVVSNFPYRIASVATAIIAAIVVCFGFSGVTKTNGVIVPLLLLCVGIIFAIKTTSVGTIISPEKSTIKDGFGGLLYAILFVCSNMFFSGFIFSKIGTSHTKKELFFGGLLGSFLLFLSLTIITFLLFLCPEASLYDMPIVFLGASLNKAFGIIVLFVVWLGLLSTAFAVLFTITNWLKEYIKNTAISAILVSFVALILSGIGFSSFVSFVYPMMGILGFFHIIFVVKSCFKNKKHKKLVSCKK